jgi:hypothetical protein
VGASGLRYGQRADGSGVGNGDDPCANHENRIYVRVRNGGDQPADNIVVRVNVTDPLGVGIRGSHGWTPVGTATSAQFPALASLAPGGHADVYVNWTPRVARLHAGAFAFHSCLQVTINPVPRELVTSNQDGDAEQENIDNFEATEDTTGRFHVDNPHIYIRNLIGIRKEPQISRVFFVSTDPRLPHGWSYRVGNGAPQYNLAPGETKTLPVTIKVPAHSRIGRTYYLGVQASTLESVLNPAISPTQGVPRAHAEGVTVGGVILAAQTVLPSSLKITATATHATLQVIGRLRPALRAIIAVDYGDLSNPRTALARTSSAGLFKLIVKIPKKPLKGVGTHAFWQGDKAHAAASSNTVTVPLPQ